jgi:hypothetical protein
MTVPKRKHLNREQRLHSAKTWLQGSKGQLIVKDYRKYSAKMSYADATEARQELAQIEISENSVGRFTVATQNPSDD